MSRASSCHLPTTLLNVSATWGGIVLSKIVVFGCVTLLDALRCAYYRVSRTSIALS